MIKTKGEIALCYAHALGEGGYPRDIRWLASALKKQNFNVVVYANSHGVETTEGLSDDVIIRNISILESSSESIACAHFFGIFVRSQMPIMKALQKKGVPIILSPWAQVMPLAMKKNWILKRLYLIRHKRVFANVMYWSVFSEIEWSAVRCIFGNVSGERVFGGLGHYPLVGKQRANFQTKKDPDDSHHFLFFGRCDVWQKGLDILIESFSVLIKICALYGVSAPKLTIAGRPYEDSEVRMKETFSEYGSDGIKRLCDVTNEEIEELYASADSFIYLSRFDGPPRPLRQAMDYGVRVIASLEANVSEELSILGAGNSVSLEPDAIALQMFSYICEHRTHNKPMRNNEVNSVTWSWDYVASKYAEAYKMI